MWKITLLPKEKRPGIRPFKFVPKGQVGIETSIAFVTIIIFLWGVTQIFLYMNRSIITRQRSYQASRTRLGATSAIDFYDAKSTANRLYVFPEER